MPYGSCVCQSSCRSDLKLLRRLLAVQRWVTVASTLSLWPAQRIRQRCARCTSQNDRAMPQFSTAASRVSLKRGGQGVGEGG